MEVHRAGGLSKSASMSKASSEADMKKAQSADEKKVAPRVEKAKPEQKQMKDMVDIAGQPKKSY
jgi:hypothetical protein